MPEPRGRATVAALAVVLGLLAAALVLYFQRGLVPGDAFTYLAAGERLNAGHRCMRSRRLTGPWT